MFLFIFIHQPLFFVLGGSSAKPEAHPVQPAHRVRFDCKSYGPLVRLHGNGNPPEFFPTGQEFYLPLTFQRVYPLEAPWCGPNRPESPRDGSLIIDRPEYPAAVCWLRVCDDKDTYTQTRTDRWWLRLRTGAAKKQGSHCRRLRNVFSRWPRTHR